MIKFIGAGFQRCGTTWLYNQLKSNEEVYMPPKKELHYFDRSNKYSSNSDLNASSLKKRLFSLRWYKIFRRDILKSLRERNYKDTVFYLKWHLSNYNDRWYLNLFKENYVSGEITPSYSLLEENELLSIKNIAPDVKIIFIIRNPIERSWSQFKYNQKFHKHLKNYNESEIIQFLKQKKVIDRSNYSETLKKYYKIFPAKNILITFYDSILTSPDNLLDDINKFLGINSSSKNYHSINNIYNSSSKIVIPDKVHDFLKEQYKNQINYLAQNIGGYSIVWKEKLNKSNHKNNENDLFSSITLNQSLQ